MKNDTYLFFIRHSAFLSHRFQPFFPFHRFFLQTRHLGGHLDSWLRRWILGNRVHKASWDGPLKKYGGLTCLLILCRNSYLSILQSTLKAYKIQTTRTLIKMASNDMVTLVSISSHLKCILCDRNLAFGCYHRSGCHRRVFW